MTEIVATSQASASGVQHWVTENCKREALRPGGFGRQIWAVADAGKISEE